MSDIPTQLPPQMQQMMDDVGPEPGEVEPYARKFTLLTEQHIPVSKARGKLWQSRCKQGKEAIRTTKEAWDEAVKYYNNDQLEHREVTEESPGNRLSGRRINDSLTETENLVYANVNAMLPMLYARNPRAEFTAIGQDEAHRELSRILEKLVNAVMSRKAAPGISIKNKAKRCVITAMLTNRAYLQLDWTFKQDSSEQARQRITELSKQLAKAKDIKEIEKIEGELMAIDEKVEMLEREGFKAQVVSPWRVIIDPEAEEADLSDARWLMVADAMPTTYINAMYGAGEKDGQVKSKYKPNYVLKVKVDAQGNDDKDNNPLFETTADDGKKYGYDDKDAFEKAKRSKVWWVWDKVTRRVELYLDNDWTWPLWVWDDPYKLDTFYNIYPLSMYTHPTQMISKGEITYILDQQDAVNVINSEFARARQWARKNVVFDLDSGLSRDDVEKILKGDDGTARGVKLPDGKKITEIIQSIVPPALNYDQLFKKDDKYAAIDRITGTNEALRGGQFKTNTTNQAISNYQQAANSRLDEKVDAIEDWVGSIAWGVAQMCMMFMSKEMVSQLIGPVDAQTWQNLPADIIAQTVNLTVVGGSTQKPTSQAKKQEAIEVVQALGQFGKVAPSAILISLKVLEQAFDEVVITDEDWKAIRQELAGQFQQQQQQATQPGPNAAGAENGGASQAQQGQGQANVPESDVAQQVAALSPQQKQLLQQLIAQGMKPTDALMQVSQQQQQPA